MDSYTCRQLDVLKDILAEETSSLGLLHLNDTWHISMFRHVRIEQVNSLSIQLPILYSMDNASAVDKYSCLSISLPVDRISICQRNDSQYGYPEVKQWVLAREKQEVQ